MTSNNRWVPTGFAVLFDDAILDLLDGDEDEDGILAVIDEFWGHGHRTKCIGCSTEIRPGGAGASCVLYDEANAAVMAFCRSCASRYHSAEDLEDGDGPRAVRPRIRRPGAAGSAMRDVKRRRKPSLPQRHGARLLKILQANLEHTRDPALRERLKRAIDSLKKRKMAA